MGGDWKEMFGAVEKNDFDLLRYHVSQGIDLNYQHPEVLTSPLIESITRNHIDMMIYLLEHGAKPDILEVFSQKSPMQIAKELRNREAVDILNRYMGTAEKLEEIEVETLFKSILKLFR